MADLDAFRTEVREFLETKVPESLRGNPGLDYWGGRDPVLPHPESKNYCDLMFERGWTAPTWPTEYGGGGLSRGHEKILGQELGRLKLPEPLVGFGLKMIGPTLLQYGTEAQKQEHLNKITRGQIRWCQGYSEPGSGSDLASISTSAVRDGDEFVLNGQKVWTSYADLSDWMFLLVRTDPNVKKQQGITFLLMDMDQPGVEVKPILLISGNSPFCESFFTDARAHVRNVIHEINAGWTVAKALLGHERNMIADIFGGAGGPGSDGATRPGNRLAAMAKQYLGERDGQVADPILRDRVTALTMDHKAFMLTVQRSMDAARAGQLPGPESSIFKVFGTELNQAREELMLSIRGPQSTGWEGDGFDEDELAQTRTWLRSRGNTIEGGTSEVQFNIIAKRVLELPD